MRKAMMIGLSGVLLASGIGMMEIGERALAAGTVAIVWSTYLLWLGAAVVVTMSRQAADLGEGRPA